MNSEILQQLPDHFPWKDRIHCFDEVDSTNRLAKQIAQDGSPHGTVIIARRQSAGRGRLGRSFDSKEGGLYFSLILRPQCPARALMHLTCAAAVAACDAVEAAAGIRPGIKWTNDLVVGTKKLAGILTELSLDMAGNVSFAVIGIGINCLQRPEDFPLELRGAAASLCTLTGNPVSPARMAAHLIQALQAMELSDVGSLMVRYRRDCITLGKDISLVRGDEVRHGRALDVDDEGGLVVQFPDGTCQSITSGEVSVRGMYGYV